MWKTWQMLNSLIKLLNNCWKTGLKNRSKYVQSCKIEIHKMKIKYNALVPTHEKKFL